ncbi:MAG: voltage-gated sodium channel [Cyclobacteriaceae bacterium]|jgi:voltage-gated sodium channel
MIIFANRQKLRLFIESSNFQNTIIGLIIINSILIGLETSPDIVKRFGFFIDQFDRIILVLFIVEIGIKLYAYGWSFFKSTWNLFDASIILISVMPSIGAAFSVLRALRILRTLRLLKNIPKLKIIIESLLHAIPSIGWIMVLLLIIFYIFTIIGNTLFSETHPEYFGTFLDTLFTLFQTMTLESWASNIARPIIKETPFASIYFVIFILIATYTTLNIFIAIVVNTMNELHHKELMEEEKHIKEFVHVENEHLEQKMTKMQTDIKELKTLMQQMVDNQKVNH